MNQLYTKWGETLDKENVMPEYPRPQMQRDSYHNLNGSWDYALLDNDAPETFDGKITVPFSPESVLSGVNQFLDPDHTLFYHRIVKLPDGFVKSRLLLHFGAIDQEAKVYIDKQPAGVHKGGFTPFTLDITDLVKNPEFAIEVKVKDLSDTSYMQTGKQRIKRGGIFYTPQSGIWQTVWMESLPADHITDFRYVPDFDQHRIEINFETNSDKPKYPIKVKLYYQGTLLQKAETPSKNMTVALKEWHPWTPEIPDLYDIEIEYGEDAIKSYFGMRKFERKPDSFGIMRFYLNNKPYFLSGVLDQGYYPDGLLTPPSDEAMEADIILMKQMGFHLIRKHIKLEPLRWYYHCDRLGMVVWQDIPSGSEKKDIATNGILAQLGINIRDKHYRWFGRKEEAGRIQFESEVAEAVNHLKNCVCISAWVPFNEAWGQFDSLRISESIAKTDPTRQIDHASGWSDQGGGDFYSRHIYFSKIRFSRKKAYERIMALTEFGGYSLLVEGHSFNPYKVYGYKKFTDKAKLEVALINLYDKEILPAIEKGLSVLVYTQLSDVEDEVNGLVTYDRKYVKFGIEDMRQINKYLLQAFKASLKSGMIK